mgnify:CR=1 FL=1
MPSLHIGAKVIQFNNLFVFANMSAATLNIDGPSQQAILVATAESFGHGVSTGQLLYIGAIANSRRLVLSSALRGSVRRLVTSSCTVTIEATVPVEQLGTSNATAAWTALTQSLSATVTSGTYQTSLTNASAATGAGATAHAQVEGVQSTAAIVFETTGTPTYAPTYVPPVLPDPSAAVKLILLGFYILVAFVQFSTSLFVYWTQVTFNSNILTVLKGPGPLAAAVGEHLLCSLSTLNFLFYLTVYGDHQKLQYNEETLISMNPLLMLAWSRLITFGVCVYVMVHIFGTAASSLPSEVRNQRMASADERMQDMQVTEAVALPTLLYRQALGYSTNTPANANDDSRHQKLSDSRLFPAVFPAYIALIIFACLESKLISRLPWIRTEKTLTLKGYPTIGIARLCLYSSIASHGLQLLASLLKQHPDIMFMTISALQLLYSVVAAFAFLQLSAADGAKLAIVSVDELMKIEEFNFMQREQPSVDFDCLEDSVMSLEALRKTLAAQDNAIDADSSDEEGHEVGMKGRPSVKEAQKGLVGEVELSDVNPGTYISSIKHSDKTQDMLMQQLKDAGKIGIVYIPLHELNIEIGEIMSALNAEKPYDEDRLDYLLMCLDANPEYKAQKALELQQWKNSVNRFAKDCLREMRTYVPAGIFKHSVASLQAQSVYPVGLCKRLLTKKCLWLTRISTEDICRMHEADLLNKFNPTSQGLDIVEIAAIYAQMPDKFHVDASGKKESFRMSIVGHLKELMAKKEKGTLTKSQTRNVLYEKVSPAYVSSRQSLHSLSSRDSEVPSISARSGSGTGSSSRDTLNPMQAALPPPPLTHAGAGASSSASTGSTAREEARKAGTNRPPPAFAHSLEAMVKKRQTSVTDTNTGTVLTTASTTSSSTSVSHIGSEPGGQRPPPAFADALAARAKKCQVSVNEN